MFRKRRTTFDFTLATSGRDVLDDEVFDALHEAGCDDSLVGRVGGVDRLSFTREAGSYSEAVRSAIEDIQSVPGMRVTRVFNELSDAVNDFAAAVNEALAAPAQCPDSPTSEERADLVRIWEMATRAPSGSISG